MDFEAAFIEYLKSFEADEIFDNYYNWMKKAFLAGYKAGRNSDLHN